MSYCCVDMPNEQKKSHKCVSNKTFVETTKRQRPIIYIMLTRKAHVQTKVRLKHEPFGQVTENPHHRSALPVYWLFIERLVTLQIIENVRL